MLIVSQEKDAIINFNNIANLVVIENNIVSICNIEESTGITIAEYKTEKRAKEVLQEIINVYKKVVMKVEIRGMNKQRVSIGLPPVNPKTSINPYIPKVYEMPKE